MGIPPLRIVPAPLGANWINACQASKTGGPIPNLFNTLLALRNDPYWTERLRFNDMLRSSVLDDQPIEDDDVFRAHEWMQTNGLRRLGIDPIREAIEIVSRETPFHPVRDELDATPWDGTPRNGGWLHACLGTDDDAYYSEIGACFLIALVSRIYAPGCKADYMPVLEGPQGALKSTVCRTLAGDPYFSDSLPDLGSDHVRVSMHLRGKWIIEVSELSAFSRAETHRLKAFLTTQVEQFTPKHARKEVREPRQCLFIATTNDDHWNRDPTGARRFWPVKCGTINLPRLAAERSQMLAEAVHHMKLGSPNYPHPDFEAKFIKPIQDARFETDAWDEAILAYLLGRPRLTLAELAYDTLGIEKNRLGRTEQTRIIAILKHAGWRSHRSTGGAHYWMPS